MLDINDSCHFILALKSCHNIQAGKHIINEIYMVLAEGETAVMTFVLSFLAIKQ